MAAARLFSGCAPLVVDKLQKTVSELASQRADYIVALAKSRTLNDFGVEEAADAIVKPDIFEGE